MDKIEKALQKLSEKERNTLKQIFRKILSEDFVGLDIKKLKGRNDIYRIRKGPTRIIYHLCDDGTINILTVERRSDTTYKF